MNKLLAFLILLGMWLGCASPAAAQIMTGADLVKSCDSTNMGKVHRCIGYVAGVIDYQLMMQSLGTTPATDFCLPQNATIEAVTVNVVEYIRKSPYHQAFIAAPAVAMALQERFPCAKPKAKKKKRK